MLAIHSGGYFLIKSSFSYCTDIIPFFLIYSAEGEVREVSEQTDSGPSLGSRGGVKTRDETSSFG
jgi:hypothetical protein